MNQKKMVYISYASDDAEQAEKLYSNLKKAGIKPWMDTKDMLPGQDRDFTIRQAIKNCKYFLTLISCNSVTQTSYVHKELKIALKRFDELVQNTIYIIPVSLDSTKPTDKNLEELEIVDLHTSYDKGLNRILSVLIPKKEPRNWDEIFVGRESIVRKLLDTQKDSFIFGARRIGKTSLMRHMENKLWEKNIPAFLFSIQGFKQSEKIKRKIKNSFKRQKFAVNGIDESVFNDFSFYDFLDELEIQLNQQIVFLIDEAEQISVIEQNEPGFADKFRNRIESSEMIRFILTASPHFTKVIIKSHCSTFLSAFEIDTLPVLTREESSELMRSLVHNIMDNEIEQILQFTYYQPYLIKIFIGKLLHNGKLRQPSREIAMDAYISNLLDGIFPNYFDGLNANDQEIVNQVYCGEFQFDEKYEIRLRTLTQYGYLKHEDGEYKISNWFFKHWLDCEHVNADNSEWK